MTSLKNYSKWDNLELSDDEDNFHPNIDNNLMIRLQREKRQQREAEGGAKLGQRAQTARLRLRRLQGALRRVRLASGEHIVPDVSHRPAAAGYSVAERRCTQAPPLEGPRAAEQMSAWNSTQAYLRKWAARDWAQR